MLLKYCMCVVSNFFYILSFLLIMIIIGDQMGNKGAFIRFEADMKPQFTKFDAVPHPNVPPMRYAGGSMFGL